LGLTPAISSRHSDPDNKLQNSQHKSSQSSE
jgi:hypothetical protein